MWSCEDSRGSKIVQEIIKLMVLPKIRCLHTGEVDACDCKIGGYVKILSWLHELAGIFGKSHFRRTNVLLIVCMLTFPLFF